MTTSPFSVRLKDGRVVDNLDYQNAAEQVVLYQAEWLNIDAALSAVSDQRENQRHPKTVDAKAESSNG